MKHFLTLFIFICSHSLWSQTYEFLGVVKVNDTIPVQYRINFVLKNNVINGTSITDEKGKYETKSVITGGYLNDTLHFKEIAILYTKADFEDLDFCYVHFKEKMKLSKNQKNIKGNFTGKFPDGTACLNGSLQLNSIGSILKAQKKILKKITKSKKIQQAFKENKIDVPDKIVSSNHINVIKKNQNTGIFWSHEVLKLEVWDNGQIDGDVIDLYVDDKIILRGFTISSQVKTINIPLNKKRTVIKVVSKSEGKTPQTTASLNFIDGNNSNEILTSLSLYEESMITILK
ncbi:hypothetical protein ACXGQW_06070 [Wenyingzhuangia sp. IMCC45533]